MSSNSLQRIEQQAIAYQEDELSIEQVLAQVQKIQLVMERVMKSGEHFGVIPGTNKPTLLKPGAEKLCLTFRLDPQYESTETYDGAHLTVKSRCTLYHITTGNRLGSGEGSCSTKEAKYAYRKGERTCPGCGAAAIIKGKAEYGGGWVCFGKKGGCGAKYEDGDQSIEGQQTGRIANPDLADQYNTVLKMANKRSLVAAVLNVTAASDIFTQDLEEQERPSGSEPAHDPLAEWRNRFAQAMTADEFTALIAEARTVPAAILKQVGKLLGQAAKDRGLKLSTDKTKFELQNEATKSTAQSPAEPAEPEPLVKQPVIFPTGPSSGQPVPAGTQQTESWLRDIAADETAWECTHKRTRERLMIKLQAGFAAGLSKSEMVGDRRVMSLTKEQIELLVAELEHKVTERETAKAAPAATLPGVKV